MLWHNIQSADSAPRYGYSQAWRGLVITLALLLPTATVAVADSRIPVIDVTDLYHPPQDPGDNVDLIAAYALPEIDLKAVILDVSARFRDPVAEIPELNVKDAEGPREPGFLPVLQLNYLFDRNVPCAAGPFRKMTSPDDAMRGVSAFESAGIDLLLATLEASSEPVEIVSFGSLRPVAVALNRNPELMRAKTKRVHICAGASSPEFLEWNVMLDPHAFVRVLRSDLPLAIYPCATQDGPFALGPNNCFWALPTLDFVRELAPGLMGYVVYAIGRSGRPDYLRAMDEAPPVAALEAVASRRHCVWETAVWLEVAGRRLVKRSDGSCRIVAASDVLPGDVIFPNAQRPCTIDCQDNGMFSFAFTDAPSRTTLYDRGDPVENQRALQEALPELYKSFRLPSADSMRMEQR